MSRGSLIVAECGSRLRFSPEDLMRYHGPGSPGGVAHAYKVLERALPLLGPAGVVERREITLRTAFGGPGARDGFELVTRAVSDGRYVVDQALALKHRGRALERFVFELKYRRQRLRLTLREGFVDDEFIDLARREDRSGAEEELLVRLKLEMAERLLAAPASAVYDASGH